MGKLVKRLTKKNCGAAGLEYRLGDYLYKGIIKVRISFPEYGWVHVCVSEDISWFDSVPQPLRIEVWEVMLSFQKSKWSHPSQGVDLEALRADLEKLYQDVTAVYAGSKG